MSFEDPQIPNRAPVFRMDPYGGYPLIVICVLLAWLAVILIDALEDTSLVAFDLHVIPSGLLATLVILVVGLCFMGWAEYNHLSSITKEAEAKWTTVKLEISRRDSLAPDLEKVVDRFLRHEKDTFESVVRARRQLDEAAGSPEKIEAYHELTRGWSRFMAVVESHPELTSQPSIQSLQVEIVRSADRINSVEREYNQMTQVYNTLVDRFPTRFICYFFGFQSEMAPVSRTL